MHFGFEHQPLGIYQEVALAALDLLGAIVPPLPSDPRRFGTVKLVMDAAK